MVNKGKLRLLRILQLLREETDQEHPLSTARIKQILKERWDIDAYRITIQNDIATLTEAGYEIETIHSTQNKYCLAGRLFELPELKLLIDAVESGKFISVKKSRALVEKLMTLASSCQAATLKRNISISGRVKGENEQLYYIMDTLNDAINSHSKVRFFYFEYDGKRRKRLKNGGEPYILSPYTLTWNGDYYYVVGWSEKHDKLAAFRVDRIERVPAVLAEKARPKPKQYSIGDYAEKAFQLFDARRSTVTLLCENRAMNTVMDHFGEHARPETADPEHFRLSVEVSLSPTFYAWVFEFGGMIRIEGPEEAKAGFQQLLKKAAAVCQGSPKASSEN